MIMIYAIRVWIMIFTNWRGRVYIKTSFRSIKFKFGTCEKSKPQNTWVFVNLAKRFHEPCE